MQIIWWGLIEVDHESTTIINCNVWAQLLQKFSVKKIELSSSWIYTLVRKHMMFSQRKSGRRSGFQITGTGSKRHQQCGKDERGNKKKIYTVYAVFILKNWWLYDRMSWPIGLSAHQHIDIFTTLKEFSLTPLLAKVEWFLKSLSLIAISTCWLFPKRIFYFLNVMSPPYSDLCIVSKVVCILYRK